MFDHALYDRVRTKYHAVGAFSELYDKIRPVSCDAGGRATTWARLLTRCGAQEPWLLEDRHEDDLL